MSWFSSALGSITRPFSQAARFTGRAVGTVARPVVQGARFVGREVDTATRGVTRPIGRAADAAGGLARRASNIPGVGSALVVATGGLSLLDPRLRQAAAGDYAIGAATGASLVGGGKLADVLRNVGSAPFMPPRPETDRGGSTDRGGGGGGGGGAPAVPELVDDHAADLGALGAAAQSKLDLSHLVMLGGAVLLVVLLVALFRRRR